MSSLNLYYRISSLIRERISNGEGNRKTDEYRFPEVGGAGTLALPCVSRCRQPLPALYQPSTSTTSMLPPLLLSRHALFARPLHLHQHS
ncbi:hypothetical protein E2C01_010969 [Portunus trituberculatus]|uniref:Uncharacterized protein n=1 Tax=Portunus trituberculatus TaxID=210409 RepID=A0A5B7DAA2_PORTR|nr:hypothetical protein [Portunus trituberculatus]